MPGKPKMSTAEAAILGDTGSLTPSSRWDSPRTHGHSVQFYEDESFLLEGLGRFIGAALVAGDSALVIASKAHCDGLSAHLRSRGLDITLAIEEGRFLSLDAVETLAKFMVDGRPEPARCARIVGDLITRLASAARGETRRVAAFGEMVALLWREGCSIRE